MGRRHKRNISEEEKSLPPPIPATAEQLAEIRALQNNAQRLVRMMNRPWSMLLTIFTVPPMIYWLFISDHSPLNRIAEDFFYQFSGDHSLYSQTAVELEDVDSNISRANSMLNNTMSGVQNIIAENRVLYPYPWSDEMVLNFLDYEISRGKIRSLLIDAYQICTNQQTIQAYDKWNVARTRSVIAIEDLKNNYQTSEIYTIVKYEMELFLNLSQKKLDITKASFTITLVRHVILSMHKTFFMLQYFTYLLQIAVSMFIQYAIVDRIFNYFFTYGKTSLSTDYLTEQKASDYIDTETLRQKNNLQPTADRNITIANYVSLIAVPLIAFYYWNYEEPDAKIVVAILSAVGMAATNFWENYQAWRKQKLLRSAFDYQRSLVQESASGVKVDIQDHLGADLNSSYFVMKFKSLNRDGVHFSAVKLANMFKNVCAYLNIAVESRRDTSVSVLAPTMNTKQSQAAQKLFSDTLQQATLNQQFIKHIKNFITKIVGQVDDITIVPDYRQDNHLPTVSVRFLLPKNSDANWQEKIKTLFHCEINIFNETHDEVIATGLNQFDAEELQKLSTEIRQFIQPENEPSTDEKSFANTVSYSKNPAVKKSQKTIAEEKYAPQPLLKRTIHWGNKFHYNSESKENNVFPLLLYGQEHSKKNESKTKFFVACDLDWNKLPQNAPADLKEKIEAMVQQPKFAKQFGEEGWKFCRGEAIDQHGKKFPVASKGKFLGALGNFGIFAQRVDSTFDNEGGNSVLLVAKGISFDRHKNH